MSISAYVEMSPAQPKTIKGSKINPSKMRWKDFRPDETLQGPERKKHSDKIFAAIDTFT